MIAVGIVPARGGSKGIPRKNICMLAGRPLLAYTADAALGSRVLSRCLLSTDDPEIAEVGRNCGLEVPFLRPAELAADSTPSIDVVVHVAKWLTENGQKPDILVLLQPTAPLRTTEDIDKSVDLMLRRNADSVVSVCEVPSHYAPAWQLERDENGELHLLNGRPLHEIIPQRQMLPRTYFRNGAIYAVRTDLVLQGRRLYGERSYGYVMPRDRSVNIDTPDDLAVAARLIKDRCRETRRDQLTCDL